MKGAGQHPSKALSALQVRSLSEPGRYADGNGLYLVVDPSGAKHWILRTVVQGRRRDMGLGSCLLVSLAEAREDARRHRRIARTGGDPFLERARAKMVVPSFAQAAQTVHLARLSAWRNDKHQAQWLNTLRDYAFPLFGTVPVNLIETPHILRALSPIWLTKPETARRLRQRIKAVLDWAKAAGFRSGDNPVDGVTKGLPRSPAKTRHHPAMPFTDVPAFMAPLLEDVHAVSSQALAFLVLTASRTSEVLHARWDEIDTAASTWTVPGGRMKAGRPHRVPLPPACVAILRHARACGDGSPLIFSRQGKALSNMALLMTMRRMRVEYTVHGFRSTFRDWASETTHFSREVCEMALAHSIGDKTEAAYRRGDLFEKRRELMAAWAAFCAS